LHTGSIPVVAFKWCPRPADDAGMKRQADPRVETHRTVRRGERTIEVRVITYPPVKRRG
jgi:hypothetical protein